jgi:hypothetical protein
MEICGYENYLIYPDGRVGKKRFPDIGFETMDK